MCLQESIKIPVAILKVGETRQARLDIEFPDAPVTFTLIQVKHLALIEFFYYYLKLSYKINDVKITI